VIGKSILFVPYNKASVRSLGFSFQVDGYTGVDVSKLANHMFTGSGADIVDWAFVRSPDPRVFAVLEDGTALTLTFDPEQEVVAWTRWDTPGDFEAVASTLPTSASTDEQAYFVVKRTINGSTVRFVERTASRRFQEVEDCFFVDSGLSLDSPTTISGATAADPVVLTVTSHPFSNGDFIDITGIKWTPTLDDAFTETQPDQLNSRRYVVAASAANTVTLLNTDATVKFIEGVTQANPAVVSSTAHGYTDGDIIGINDVVGMTALNGVMFKVASGTDDTFELTDLSDVDIDSSAYGAWTSGGSIRPGEDGSAFDAYVESGEAREAVLTLSGLAHLKSTDVVILADGNVIADKTVSATGTITLDRRASRVHVGLRYTADIETLDIENSQGPSIQGKKVRIPEVTAKFKDSRGFWVGESEDTLLEVAQREFELMGSPTALLTGDKRMALNTSWNNHGRLYLRQIYPLPMTLLALVPEVDTED
jgi:hypothetical protein